MEPLFPIPLKPLSPEEEKGAFSLAKARLQRGWCKHTSTNQFGDVCLMWALQLGHEQQRPDFVRDTMYVLNPYEQLSSILLKDPLVKERASHKDQPHYSDSTRVTLFNDHPDTTQEEVLSLLDRQLQ